MPRSNVFIYTFTAIEISFTPSQQLVELQYIFRMSLVLLAHSWGGGACTEYKDNKVFIVK